MRIEEYTRKLTDVGYVVVGGQEDWYCHNSAVCDPIEMTLTCYPGTNEPYYDNLDELIKLADSDMFVNDDEDFDEGDKDFCNNYPDIIRGICPGWQLGAFRVFRGGIELFYGNPKTKATGFLWIVGAQRLMLTFRASMTCWGFRPTYNVYIHHIGKKHYRTQVEEDLGYVRRKIEFIQPKLQPQKQRSILWKRVDSLLRRHTQESDSCFHIPYDDQLVRITEYAGM